MSNIVINAFDSNTIHLGSAETFIITNPNKVFTFLLIKTVFQNVLK